MTSGENQTKRVLGNKWEEFVDGAIVLVAVHVTAAVTVLVRTRGGEEEERAEPNRRPISVPETPRAIRIAGAKVPAECGSAAAEEDYLHYLYGAHWSR